MSSAAKCSSHFYVKVHFQRNVIRLKHCERTVQSLLIKSFGVQQLRDLLAC